MPPPPPLTTSIGADLSRKLRIEGLSKFYLTLSYAVAVGFFVLLLFVVGFFAPDHVYDRNCSSWFRGSDQYEDTDITPMRFMRGTDALDHTSPSFTNWNQDFFFYLTLYRGTHGNEGEGIGFDIFPFKLNIVVVENDTNLSTFDWENKANVFSRHLVCPRQSLGTAPCPNPGITDGTCPSVAYTSVKPARMCGTCRIVLAHESFLSTERPNYRIAIKVANNDTERSQWESLMEKDILFIQTMYKFPSEDFTLFGVYVRYSMFFFSFLVAVLYWLQNRSFEEWKRWSLDQKCVMLLLFSLCFFNNPLHIFTIASDHWLFLFVDELFASFFFMMFLFCVMLVISNLYKEHPRPSDLQFFVPKFILLGCLFLVRVIFFWIARSRQKENIAENDLEDVQVQGFQVYTALVSILISFYGVWLLYLIIRAYAQWSQDLHAFVPRRIKFLWLTALVMLGVVISDTLIFVRPQSDSMQAVHLFAYYAVYNFYISFLAFMYCFARASNAMHVAMKPMSHNSATTLGHQTVYRPSSSSNNPLVSVDADADGIFDDEEDI